jgi:hypothetical protein
MKIQTQRRITRPEIENIVQTLVSERLAPYASILDGVSLQELTNYTISPSSLSAGESLILALDNSNIVAETGLNGGNF